MQLHKCTHLQLLLAYPGFIVIKQVSRILDSFF